MKYISGVSSEEIKLVKAIQKSVGAYADNSIGPVTLADIAIKLKADCFPLAVSLYEQPSIICKDILAFNPKTGLKNYKNSISGSFSYQSKPCSFLVNNGEVVFDSSCHSWLNQPESVLYRLKDGSFGIKRCVGPKDLPKNVKWAIGGVGLLNMYDPKVEGFTGKYSDVLRLTNHTMIGVKNSMIYLCYCKNMTAAQVNAHAKKLNLEYAIMLDGGHVAAINSTSTQLNTSQIQYYVIQAI